MGETQVPQKFNFVRHADDPRVDAIFRSLSVALSDYLSAPSLGDPFFPPVPGDDITLLPEHAVILVDCTPNDVRVNLPDVATIIVGKIYNVKKIDPSGNVVIFDPFEDQTIDGELECTMPRQYDNLTLYNDGTQWWIL